MCNIQQSFSCTHEKHVQRKKSSFYAGRLKKIIARFVIFVMNEYECIFCISMSRMIVSPEKVMLAEGYIKNIYIMYVRMKE